MENKIRQRREELGISQVQLARALGTDPALVCRWEKGQYDPTLFNALCLAQVLDTTVEELFGP